MTSTVVLDACIAGVGRAAIRTAFIQHHAALIAESVGYDTQAAAGTLHTIPGIFPLRGVDPIALGALSRRRLVTLYENYLLGTEKPARTYYTQLFRSATHCPFCGSLNQVNEIDHLLPKAHFPQFSVHPSNLIPACTPCNKTKKASVPATAGEQALHPYLDAAHFFTEQWLSAVVVQTPVIGVDYVVRPPASWSVIDQARVHAHMEKYGLLLRFGEEAAVEMANVLHKRRNSLSSLSAAEYQADLRESADSPGRSINSWSRVMYLALASSTWFCEHDPNTL